MKSVGKFLHSSALLIAAPFTFLHEIPVTGIVNLKPIVHGHVLIIPKRICPRFSDLTEAEVADLFLCVHKIAPRLELHYKCSALNIAIQDGADAGNDLLWLPPLYALAHFRRSPTKFRSISSTCPRTSVAAQDRGF